MPRRRIRLRLPIGLRHAAGLSHPPIESRAQQRREVVSYMIAMVTSAIIMAAFLFFIVPRGFAMPLT